jgi:hypothetical protein
VKTVWDRLFICLGDEFEVQAAALINEFLANTIQKNRILLSTLRLTIAGIGTQRGTTLQSFQINGTQVVRRYSPAPPNITACACSVALYCPNSFPSKARFLCTQGNNCTAGSTIWTVPGLVTACSDFESLFASDLRCLFDQTCFAILLSMFNADMPNRLPLPEATLAIAVLNSSAASRFLPNDTLGTIADQSFVEEWEVRSNFIGYYESCAPPTCTYKVVRRVDYIYIVTVLVSLFGGLVVVFRLLVPVAVRFASWMIRQWRDRHRDVSDRAVDHSTGE